MGFSVLVTGANRGIGLGLVRELASRSDVTKVFAGVRNPVSFPSTNEAPNKEKIQVVQLEISDQKSVDAAEHTVQQALGGSNGDGLDMLINCAGIISGPSFTRVEECDPEEFIKTLNVNVVGTHRVTVAFLPLLRRGPTKKVVNISSTLGSISELGRRYPTCHLIHYNSSKAALNSITRSYAIDFEDEGFIFFPICPGYVKTDMSPNGFLTVEESASNIANLAMKATKKYNGVFYDSVTSKIINW
ncbi:hypothetical protein BDA99DRAFT_445909 [Phascolomyces articulosus]|uniref:NAD(P)-binding protein n=1 Tax=Phascolomyces articulosus TaxID=60185 RepID=A0AAD5JPS3_9FUNG|nr:hypothetical protein BDA99DRAFT_445909 [Phascolomyces articulosus]